MVKHKDKEHGMDGDGYGIDITCHKCGAKLGQNISCPECNMHQVRKHSGIY